MAQVIKFIENHKNNLQPLTDLGIKYKTLDCKEHGTLYIFNYSILTKLPKHPIVRECRNLILHKNTKEQWNLISKSFRRFYNFGEHPKESKILVDAMLDRNLTVMAYEKLDGSLMTLSYHPLLKEWRMYTRGDFAAQPFQGMFLEPQEKSFSDIFLNCLQATHEDIFSRLNPNYSYIFELCYPGSHITKYDKQFISLLTITDRTKETELASHIVNKIAMELDFIRPHSFKVTSMDQLQQKLKTMPPDFEGYILVVEKNGLPQVRVKFKQDSYKALHHNCSRDLQNPSVYIPILLEVELEEVLTHAVAKRHEEFLREKQAQVDQVFVELKHIYDKCKIASSPKAFSELIRKESHPLAKILFMVFRGTIAFDDCRQLWKASKVKKNTHIENVKKAIFWLHNK